MKFAKTFACCFYVLVIALLLAWGPDGFGVKRAAARSETASAQDICKQWPLQPLPSQNADAFQKLLSDYTFNGCYKTAPGWKHDLEVRDTGPFIAGKTYGTHNAVRVYYSPEIVKWLGGGKDSDRKEGDITDGATIIKEMYSNPAQQNVDTKIPCNAPFKDSDPPNRCNGLAIMVKDKKGSWDGWFWTDGNSPINYGNYPNAGFGLYCVNCHASAKTELTFSTLNNILGNSITFNPTMPPNQINIQQAARPRATIAPKTRLTPLEDISVHLKRSEDSEQSRSDADGTLSDQIIAAHRAPRAAAVALPTPKQLVSEWYDTATQRPQTQKQQMFLTSNQCIGCHDATQNNATMPNMMYQQIYNFGGASPTPTPQELDLNLSPYSEWRSSLMGLSGRDPVFYSQLETEMNLYPGIKDQIVNTCLSCHGVMGQRQLALDTGKPFEFKLEYLDRFGTQPFAEYGGLARDGVSCAVCHHISNEGLGTPATYTGKFNTGKPEEIFGPYQDVALIPMKNSLGLTPLKTKENQIAKSALCGSCHTVILPVLTPGQPYSPGDNLFTNNRQKTEHEQNTYLEWRNSKYQDERPPIDRAAAQSCQQCHMPGLYPQKTGQKLQYKVASIEDETFAAVEFRAPDEDIHLRVRGGAENPAEGYSRHTLVGLNLFVMEIFNQFSAQLGISTQPDSNNVPVPFYDPMATWGNSVPSMVLTKKSALEMARNETAQIEIAALRRTARGLSAQVKVTNLAGHRFPSGVSFRRAFLEFRVNDASGKTVWVSGDTNEMGVIGNCNRGQFVAGKCRPGQFVPLLTESFAKSSNPQQLFQPHYETINSNAQVQIYEELVKDANGNFTTSFLSLANQVKDNRLMPQGWREDGPDAKVTAPVGVDKPSNPGFFDGSGTDVVTYEVPLDATSKGPFTVTATIYYQTIPPYYLEQRFANAPNGTFTKSLKYYVNNLNTNYVDSRFSLLLNEPPIKNWKLKVVATPPRTLR
jgi:mono/diheme cytochrome c family protein